MRKTKTIAPRVGGGLLRCILLVALGAALLATGGSLAATGDPDHINFTLEGCRNDGSIALPDGNGDFICPDPDADYTTGNLGKGWNELDLVPHRVTLENNGATQTYKFVVAGDYKNGSGTGTGWDVISALILNTSLSDANCVAATSGATTITPSGQGVGGADQTIYRLITVTQQADTTCVYDYYQRLALGAHNFSGSSLQSNLWNQSLDSNGIGEKRLSLPVGEIAPQELDKDMSATQDSDHAWDVTKDATPATVSLGNTCDSANPRSAAVGITISWEKLAASPTGDITVITHVYATNPAARVITTSVTDDIYSGTTLFDTATAGPTDVPANTSNFLMLTHTITVPDGTTDLNDIATGTYVDKVTGVPIPGSTTATASATVQPSGSELNQTATISDSESISGSFQYSADSFSGASGSFDGGYLAGTPTSANVGWTSDSQSGSGSVSFAKTIYVGSGVSSSGTLSDTATLNGSDGFSKQATASVSVSSDARVKLTINKSIPNVLQGAETETFNFEVYDSGNVLVASPSISFSAGQMNKSTTVSNLAPGSYTVKETGSASGKWDSQPDQSKAINLPTCSGSVSFANTFGPAAAKVKKVTNPAGGEAGWDMTLTGPGGPETVTTTGTGFVNFATSLQEGSYTITETPKPGWDQTGSTGCSFTVDYPADSGKVFECTKTNTRRGAIIIRKVTQPNPDPSDTSFSFSAGGGLSPSTFSLKNGQQQSYPNLVPASGYSAAETTPAGWDLISATCDDGSQVSNINVGPGETVTCTFTNRARGKARVVKTVSGAALSGTQAFVFQLRSGASAVAAGTILETGTANAGNGGTVNFTTNLVPGQTYQLCEQMQPGWMTTLGPPLYSVYNPSGDNSVVCTDFTVTAGQTKTFNIDNKPPPGGMGLTIGFWKNWSSCTGGGQKPTLDQTLLKLAQAGTPVTLGLLVLNPVTQGASVVCRNAVNILSKQTLGGKKMSSDPLFNMAAQLLAADLNVGAGAGQCAASATAMNQAHALLSKYNFDGNGYSPKLTAADANLANSLGTTLDKYNNNKLC